MWYGTPEKAYCAGVAFKSIPELVSYVNLEKKKKKK